MGGVEFAYDADNYLVVSINVPLEAEIFATPEAPMQYLKKVRLTKARDLIMREREKVYIAADSVGYESTSQFSREFKRYFGEPPSAAARK